MPIVPLRPLPDFTEGAGLATVGGGAVLACSTGSCWYKYSMQRGAVLQNRTHRALLSQYKPRVNHEAVTEKVCNN
jgi:hypothetical protein